MAFEKGYEDDRGIQGDFWRVIEVNMTNLGNGQPPSVHAVLALWKDEIKGETAPPLPVTVSVDGIEHLPLDTLTFTDIGFTKDENPTIWEIMQRAVQTQVKVIAEIDPEIANPDGIAQAQDLTFFADAIEK